MNRAIQTTVQGYPVRSGPGGAPLPKTVQGLQSLHAWKQENATRPDAWLVDEVCRAFQQMLLLRLNGVPAAELVAMTAETWIQLIGYNLTEENDRERVQAGFRALFRTLKQWPQPAELLAAMPGRAAGSAKASTVTTQRSDEDHAAAAAKFQEFMDGLGGRDE